METLLSSQTRRVPPFVNELLLGCPVCTSKEFELAASARPQDLRNMARAPACQNAKNRLAAKYHPLFPGGTKYSYCHVKSQHSSCLPPLYSSHGTREKMRSPSPTGFLFCLRPGQARPLTLAPPKVGRHFASHSPSRQRLPHSRLKSRSASDTPTGRAIMANLRKLATTIRFPDQFITPCTSVRPTLLPPDKNAAPYIKLL
jgi:hypothetical protein